MPFITTAFPDLYIFEPQVHSDPRGYFFESYNESVFQQSGINFRWVQDNQSSSQYGVIRGLHFQIPPYAQTKLIRVLSGRILDVVVDIRKGSPSYGQSFGIELSADNKKQLLVPKGFAHGFLTLSETSEFIYKVSDFYSPQDERCIIWNDATLGIDWPKNIDIQLSPKDLMGETFNLSELFP